MSWLYILLTLSLIGCVNNHERLQDRTIVSKTASNLTPQPSNTTKPSHEVKDFSQSKESYNDALLTANLASNLTENAMIKEDWLLAADYWKDAINLLKTVPKTSKNYVQAQQKIQEYNKSLAFVKKAIALNVNNLAAQPKDQPPKLETQVSKEDLLNKFIVHVLESAIQKDRPLYVDWCEHTKILASTLYNPYEYEILNLIAYSSSSDDELGLIGSAKVRIKSTNAGGMQIMNVWDLTVATQQQNTEYDKKGDYCIANLSE